MDKNYLTVETWYKTWYVFPWLFYGYCSIYVPDKNYTSSMYDKYVDLRL